MNPDFKFSPFLIADGVFWNHVEHLMHVNVI